MMEKSLNISSKKLSILQKTGYAFSGISYLACQVIPAFLLYYATQQLVLSVVSVSFMMMIVKIIDGITDVIAGVIVDRTKSPKGKARPWMLRAAIPYAVCMAAMFCVPTSLGNAAKLALLTIFYVLTISVFGTMIGVARIALIARMTSDPKERSVLGILGDGLASVLAGVAFGMTMPLVGMVGWNGAFITFSVISAVCALLVYILCREEQEEVDAALQEKSPSIKEIISALLKNKYAMLILIYVILWQFVAGFKTAGGLYYFQFYLGRAEMYNLCMSLATPFGLIGMVFAGLIAKKTGKLYGIGAVLTAVFYAVITVLSADNALLIAILLAIASVFSMTWIGAALPAMSANSVDYGEWKLGTRAEGITSSAVNIGIKVGSALSTGVFGMVMGAAGFVEGSSEQPAAVAQAIWTAYMIIPLITCIIMCILFFATYRLDKMHPQIVAELNQRRHTAAK